MLILSFTKYWGWCKYHYREHPKANFALAKLEERAIEDLNSCSPDIVRIFINDWFVDAYKGTTGEVAAWVVRKQKSHRSVSKVAMKALEARAEAKIYESKFK